MNVAHCAGPCVFDGDGCVHIEGGYDSLHPFDQWLGFGQQPSPDTETTAYKPSQQPSAQHFYTVFESLKRIKILQMQHLAIQGPVTAPRCVAAITLLWAKFP